MTDLEWMELFAENLKSLMDDRGITQHELAEISGCSDSTISRYLKKRQIPNAPTITRLAYALDCDVAELIDFE